MIIDELDRATAIAHIENVKARCNEFLQAYPSRQSFLDYFKSGFDKQRLRTLSSTIDDTVEYLSNSREKIVLNKAMDYPVVRQLLTYHITNYPKLGMALAVLLPLSIPIYIIGTRHQHNLRNDVSTAIKVSDELIELLNKGQ